MGGSFHRRLFQVWFGLFVPPITIGAIALAFAHGWPLGAITLAVSLAWIVETGRTTCRRCWAYGTMGCGLPSLTAPLFGRRLPPKSLPLWRVRLHYRVDVAGAVYLNGLYLALFPALSPAVALWTAGAWMLVGRPRRFHGLLPRLRQKERRKEGTRVALPVLAAGGCRTP